MSQGQNSDAMRDACWRLYSEHCTQARQHETQRSAVASVLIAVAAAIIALLTFDRSIDASDLALELLLLALGGFGIIFSAKHYERASMHIQRARYFRNEVDSILGGKRLLELKQAADNAHEKEFPRLSGIRLHLLWMFLYFMVVLIACALLALSLCQPLQAVYTVHP